MIEGNNCCVCCGAIIPEDSQVCIDCKRKYGLLKYIVLRKNSKKDK